jgi:hypothetical protein
MWDSTPLLSREKHAFTDEQQGPGDRGKEPAYKEHAGGGSRSKSPDPAPGPCPRSREL